MEDCGILLITETLATHKVSHGHCPIIQIFQFFRVPFPIYVYFLPYWILPPSSLLFSLVCYSLVFYELYEL
jgi:hypothetical protein